MHDHDQIALDLTEDLHRRRKNIKTKPFRIWCDPIHHVLKFLQVPEQDLPRRWHPDNSHRRELTIFFYHHLMNTVMLKWNKWMIMQNLYHVLLELPILKFYHHLRLHHYLQSYNHSPGHQKSWLLQL